MTDKTDKELIAEYAAGDEEAFKTIVTRYLKPLYNFIYRLTGKQEEADDITQEVFVKLWKNIKKYNPDQNFKPWLYKITRNTTIDWQRRRKAVVFSDFETEDGENYFEESLTDLNPLPEEVFSRAEDKKFMDGVLKKISPLYREVLSLYYESDMTFDEIGKVLGKPLNTVKSQHRRAIMQLRKLLDAPKDDDNSYKD